MKWLSKLGSWLKNKEVVKLIVKLLWIMDIVITVIYNFSIEKQEFLPKLTMYVSKWTQFKQFEIVKSMNV